MQQVLKFRLQANQLEQKEFVALLNKIGKNEMISHIFRSFLYIHQKYPNQQHNEITNINHMITNIITNREINKSNDTPNKPLTIDTLPSGIIRECGSYLQGLDYLHFARCNATIYVASNLNRMMESALPVFNVNEMTNVNVSNYIITPTKTENNHQETDNVDINEEEEEKRREYKTKNDLVSIEIECNEDELQYDDYEDYDDDNDRTVDIQCNCLSQFEYNTDNVTLIPRTKRNDINDSSMKMKSRCNEINFCTSTQRQKNNFDRNNQLHMKIARKQIMQKRIKNIKNEDNKRFDENIKEADDFITAQIMLEKMEQNEMRNGILSCDICNNVISILSETHHNKLKSRMDIARFDHEKYHSLENIKTLECGLCNMLRGKMEMQCFLGKINNVLLNIKSKEKEVEKWKARINIQILEGDLKGITRNSEDNLLTDGDVIQHLTQIRTTQNKMPCRTIVYQH